MRIISSLVEDFGGFALDTDAIELRSADAQDIMLPYHGSLPKQMLPASSSYLKANTQLLRGTSLVLVVQNGDKKIRRPLDANNEEVIVLLDRFFEQQDTGLDAYWLGYRQANYISWRQLIRDPRMLLKAARTIPAQERNYIAQRLLE